MQNSKLYFILINSDMAYDYEYEVKGEKKTTHKLGAVISRHHTMKAALRARARVIKNALGPIQTDIVRLHFFIGHDDYVAEAYGGCGGFRYAPTSCLISQ
jgi:hypothetical protein